MRTTGKFALGFSNRLLQAIQKACISHSTSDSFDKNMECVPGCLIRRAPGTPASSALGCFSAKRSTLVKYAAAALCKSGSVVSVIHVPGTWGDCNDGQGGNRNFGILLRVRDDRHKVLLAWKITTIFHPSIGSRIPFVVKLRVRKSKPIDLCIHFCGALKLLKSLVKPF